MYICKDYYCNMAIDYNKTFYMYTDVDLFIFLYFV